MGTVVRIHAEAIAAKELRPGDLFSIAGPEYWDDFPYKQGVGERVYIRTCTSAVGLPDADDTVYRITVERLESN